MSRRYRPYPDRSQREDEILRLRSALDNVGAHVFIKDRDGRYTYVNRMVSELFGATREDILGSTDERFFDLSLSTDLRDHDRRVVEEAVRIEGEERNIVACSGETRYYDTVKQPLFDDDGAVVGVLGVSTDITARKLAEIALRERESLLSDILDTASVAIFLVDRDGVITHANRRMAEMFGHPLAELIGSEYVDHIHPAERDTGRQRMRALLASKVAAVDVERLYLRADGGEFWGHLTGRRFQDAQGVERGLVGVIADISATRRAIERHASVINLAMDGFLAVGADGRVRECNAAVCALTGYLREEVLGSPMSRFEALESADETAAHARRIFATGNDRFETHWRRKDGSLVEVEVTATCLRRDEEIGVFVRDIAQRKAHQDELRYIASHDLLTGLPNRALLFDRMRQAVAQADRAGTLLAVCYLDLDGFKPVNDRFGHQEGDGVLIEVARRLKGCVRGDDTVARIGGDEFVLLLQGLGDTGAVDTALRRVLAAVAQPLRVGGSEVAVSASLGAALYPRDDADTDTLLRHADQAMYLAKQGGRNRFHVFDTEQDRCVRERTERQARIAQALRDQELVLHYQPQVDMRSGRVLGAEALVRWLHPQRGLLAPAEFLPAIEDSDLIVELGDWVIATALVQLEAWRREGLELQVSVNIAARHLLRTDFVSRLCAHLDTCPQLPRHALKLEVVETAALEDLEHVSALIRECRELGVAFAVDDFGTGYSSLSYLKALPAQVLKIDQSFVRDMLADAEDRAIVEGVIGLARVFGRTVIAEGVETAEHGAMLLALGCERAQGYGIARPMPAADLPAWVDSWRPDASWQ